MQKKIAYKVPDGKLVKITMDFEDEKIVKVKIMGDFFMHPEEKIEELEKELVGVELVKETLTDKVGKFLENVDVFGVDGEGFAEAIMRCKDEVT